MAYENTKLWKDALAARESDEAQQARELLRVQLLGMRERVRQLISHIPADCQDLTIHDITHLDALWDTAQQICGVKWQLNPAEAFVFGAAVLIHDAGLTTLAYPEGRQGLRKTTVWADLAAPYLEEPEGNDQPVGLSNEREAAILFEVLRSFHADQAAELCSQAWEKAGNGPQYLIEDSELRQSFGESIGRIGASHHWSPDRLQSELSTQLGGSPSLPDWVVNEVKLACLLRCADAAQVDRTRAPLMMYAALGPQGYSDLHWRAQSKLNRPTLKDDAIHFTSSSTFKDNEADAWWVAFDLANILDRELRATNAILTDIGEQTFAAQRVAGAESPGTFSKYVRTNKWRPIDASIKVTDPLRLAKTLGGKNLYGSSNIVPFRELVQNAADAIQARRAIERRGQEYGAIQVTVEQHPTEINACLIHIDDDGIGMSERVLCTTLVDFGKSFWTSDVIRQEFPGLKSSNVRHIGKFGIGFFSVFEVSQEVRVISRRYDAGHEETRILEFRGMVARPLLREAKGTDLPKDVSTRVSLSVPKRLVDPAGLQGEEDFIVDSVGGYRGKKAFRQRQTTLREALQGLVSFLEIKVEFLDRRNGDAFEHTPNIYEKEPEELIEELPLASTEKTTKHFNANQTMRTVRSGNGDAFGRASLDIDAILAGRYKSRGFVSVGGIVSTFRGTGLRAKTGVEIPFYGVVEGQTERAARDVLSSVAPDTVIDEWVDEQLSIIDLNVLRKSETMSIGSFAFSATKKDAGLPFAFNSGSVKTVSEISEIASRVSRLSLPVNWRYDSWLDSIGYNSLSPEYFEAPLAEDVIVLAGGSERLLDEDKARELKKHGGGSMEREELLERWGDVRQLIELLESVWGAEAELRLTTRQIFSTNIASLSGERWVICVERKH